MSAKENEARENTKACANEKAKAEAKVKAKNQIVLVVAIVLALLILAAILWAVLLPGIRARREKSRWQAMLSDPDQACRVVLTDLKADNAFGTVAGEVLLEDEAAAAMLRQLANLFPKTHYTGEASGLSGTWSLRLRVLAPDGSYELYLTEDAIQLTHGATRFVFAYSDESGKSEGRAFYQSVESALAGNKTSDAKT